MKKKSYQNFFKKYEDSKNHFAEFGKMVDIGIGIQRSFENISLAMYANNYSKKIVVAEEKVNYLKSINVKQAEIKY